MLSMGASQFLLMLLGQACIFQASTLGGMDMCLPERISLQLSFGLWQKQKFCFLAMLNQKKLDSLLLSLQKGNFSQFLASFDLETRLLPSIQLQKGNVSIHLIYLLDTFSLGPKQGLQRTYTRSLIENGEVREKAFKDANEHEQTSKIKKQEDWIRPGECPGFEFQALHGNDAMDLKSNKFVLLIQTLHHYEGSRFILSVKTCMLNTRAQILSITYR